MSVTRRLGLIFEVGNKTKYVDDTGDQVLTGEVSRIVLWKEGRPERGCTVYVRHSNGTQGQFRSDNDRYFLYREDEIIPMHVLKEYLSKRVIAEYQRSEERRLEKEKEEMEKEKAKLQEENARLKLETEQLTPSDSDGAM